MSTLNLNPLIGMPGTWELILILAIILVVFGAAKLPDLARNSGQALKIFKNETRGLRDDDGSKGATGEPRGELPASTDDTPRSRPEASPTESRADERPA